MLTARGSDDYDLVCNIGRAFSLFVSLLIITHLNVSDGGLRPLARSLEQASGFRCESVWIAGLKLSRTAKITSSSTCMLSGRLVHPEDQARPRLLPRRRGSSDQASGNPLLVGRIPPGCRYIDSAGGLGRFCPAITRCSLATTSTFKAAAYAAPSPGSVVNSF
jgi:hypothetical protein